MRPRDNRETVVILEGSLKDMKNGLENIAPHVGVSRFEDINQSLAKPR